MAHAGVFVDGQVLTHDPGALYYLQSQRLSSGDRVGGKANFVVIAPGETRGLAKIEGTDPADHGCNDARPVGAGRAIESPWREPNLGDEDHYLILEAVGRGIMWISGQWNLNLR